MSLMLASPMQALDPPSFVLVVVLVQPAPSATTDTRPTVNANTMP